MAFRQPLKFNVSGGDNQFALMTHDDISNIRRQAIFELGKDPVFKLKVVNSGGSLASIDDTRTRSGAAAQNTTGAFPAVTTFPTEGQTGEPTGVSVAYDRLIESSGAHAYDSAAFDYIANTIDRPLCLDSDGVTIIQMPMEDVFDTFIRPAIDSMYADPTNVGVGAAGKMRPGMFFISTFSTNIGGADTFSEVQSATPVFSDTVANTGAFTAAQIGTAGTFQDHPQTSNDYYLHMNINQDSDIELFSQDPTTGNVILPLYYEENNQQGDGYPGFRQYSRGDFKDYLRRMMRYVSGSETNYRQFYVVDSDATGDVMGTGMVNTEIPNPGTGSHTTYKASANDYRAQEFPTGTPTAVNTMYLLFTRV